MQDLFFLIDRQLMTLRYVVFSVLRLLKGGRGRAIPIGRPIRVLVFQHERIGDYIVSTPMYRWLSERSGDVVIDAIASDLNEELVRRDPNVDTVFTIPWRHSSLGDLVRLIRSIRRQHYDLILVTSFMSRTRNAVVCCFAKGRPWCATFADTERVHDYGAFFDTVTIRRRFREHVGHVILRTAMESFADHSEPQPRPYIHHGGVPAPYIVINTMTRDPGRDWSAEDAEWLRGELLRAVPGIEVMMASPMRSLQEMVDLYANARLVISANSAPVHVAAAANVPVISLSYSDETALEWYPLGSAASRTLRPISGVTGSHIAKESILKTAMELLGVNNSHLPST